MHGHGVLGESTLRSSARNGPERLLRVHGRRALGDGSAMGDRTSCDPSAGSHFLDTLTAPGRRKDGDDQCHPHRSEDSHRRRYRHVPGHHRPKGDGLGARRQRHARQSGRYGSDGPSVIRRVLGHDWANRYCCHDGTQAALCYHRWSVGCVSYRLDFGRK